MGEIEYMTSEGKDYKFIESDLYSDTQYMRIKSIDMYIEFRKRDSILNENNEDAAICTISLYSLENIKLFEVKLSSLYMSYLYDSILWLNTSAHPFKLNIPYKWNEEYEIQGYFADENICHINFIRNKIMFTFSMYIENLDNFLEKLFFFFLSYKMGDWV